MKKDVSVEWIRIIACFLVIGAHIQLGITVNGGVSIGRLFGSSILADNVPLFFLISGYFMFAKTDSGENSIVKTYGKKTLGLFRNNLIPITILIIIIANIAPFIKNECALSACTWNIGSVKQYLFEFYCNQNAFDRAGHFWYICSYMKIFIWFPALALLCQKDERITKARRILLLLAYVVIILNDLEYLFGKDLGSFENMTFDQNMLYVVLGYEIYYMFHHSKLTIKQLRYYGLGMFIFGVIAKMSLQGIMYNLYGIDAPTRFMWLQCAPCYITSAGIFCFWHSFKDKLQSKVIGFMGKYTLYVYMFHAMVIDKCGNIREKINVWCHGCSNFFYDMLYYIIYGVFVFAVSFILGFIFERIYALLLKVFDLMIASAKGKIEKTA